MGELFEIIFGEGITIYNLLGYAWFFAIGYIIYGLAETTGRDKLSNATPMKWSWNFWVKDNWRRYLITVLTTYVLFRFYNEINGHPFSNFDAVTMGMIGDGIAATVKKRVLNLNDSRKKIMTNINEDEII